MYLKQNTVKLLIPFLLQIWIASSGYCQLIPNDKSITIEKDSFNNYYFKVPVDKGISIGNKLILLDSCKQNIVALANQVIKTQYLIDSLDKVIIQNSVNSSQLMYDIATLKEEKATQQKTISALKKKIIRKNIITGISAAVLATLVILILK